MKKHIYHKLFAGVFLFLITACADNLDVRPEEGLLPGAVISSAANLRSILIGAYDEAGQIFSYGGDINLAVELIANTGELRWNGTFEEPAQFNEKAIVADNFFVRDYWLNGFEVNNQVNIVLANLDRFEDATERDRMEGESKFLRGLIMFDLARLFGQPFKAGEQNSGPAVPIVLDPVIATESVTFPSRNTVDEVYQQAVQDLNEAYTLLPASNSFFADRYAAQALLARLYLQQGNYAAARDAANDVLNNSGHILAASFEEAFNNDSDSPEDIFAWQKNSQDGVNSINDMNTYWSGQAFGGRSGNPDVSVEPVHLDIYDDPDDERRSFFYDNPGGAATTKWQSQFANIPFLRIAEMHLIRAECNFRLGSAIGLDPLSEINALRGRSGAAPLAAIDLAVILLERRRELSFEGFTLHDIKRTQGSVGSLSYNDNRLVLPVPQRELDANPNLIPN